MKKWGLVVTLFYLIIVLAVLVPLTVLISTSSRASDLREAYTHWFTWTCVGVVVAGEILLLWLSADTTRRKLKPRRHILISALTAGLFLGILTVALVLDFGVAIWGDHFDQFFPDWNALSLMAGAFGIPWIIWGIVFYRFCRETEDPVTRAVGWLFRGSVLELLVAIPAHVIVRRRNDCCAPIATGFGIYTGIAIMLLSFGPSVLLLLKKRMEGHSK